MPRGEESKPTARKLYSLCEFGWIALNSETSPLTTPTQQLFFWLWNAPVTQKAHFQLHILFCFEPKGSCCSVTAVKLISTRSTLPSTLSSGALNRPPWNPTMTTADTDEVCYLMCRGIHSLVVPPSASKHLILSAWPSLATFDQIIPFFSYCIQRTCYTALGNQIENMREKWSNQQAYELLPCYF